MDFGLMKIAIGYNWATWSRLIAFPDTSKMQCFPCCELRENIQLDFMF